MKVMIYQKVHAVSSPIREITIEGAFDDYYQGMDQINEELLIRNLPKDFLMSLQPQDLPIMVEDKINEKIGRVLGHTGQRNLKVFKGYDKYTKRYSLLLCRYE